MLNRTYLNSEAVQGWIKSGKEQERRISEEKIRRSEERIRRSEEQRKNEKLETIKNLFVMGVDKEVIAKATGVTVQDVERLNS
ncbi:MAG: hypothetical protein ACRC30_15950 [Clostridium sp.]